MSSFAQPYIINFNNVPISSISYIWGLHILYTIKILNSENYEVINYIQNLQKLILKTNTIVSFR